MPTNNYYYLLPSLPTLFFGHSPPFSGKELLELCEPLLEKKAFSYLSTSRLYGFDEKALRPYIREKWLQWETSLRNELVILRAKKQKRKKPDDLRRYEFRKETKEIAQKAFLATSPEIAEEMLNRARWQCLDSLEYGHYFDLERLTIYYLKLQLLEKIYAVEPTIGKTKTDAFLLTANQCWNMQYTKNHG